MSLDVNDRRETWLFQELYRRQGKPVYRRLEYNQVQFGDEPELFIEPVYNAGSMDDVEQPTEPAKMDRHDTGEVGRVIDFKFFTSRPFPAQSFGDYDAEKLDV